MAEYKCEKCNYKTDRNWAFQRHLKSKLHEKNHAEPTEKLYPCLECDHKAKSRQALYMHKKSHDDYETHRYKCSLCNVTVRDIEMYEQHRKGLPHCKLTTKYIHKIKDKLNLEYKDKELDKIYYDKLSYEKNRMRALACEKLKQTIKVRKNDKRRARRQKINGTIENSMINQLIDKWSPEEWKVESKMTEQYDLEAYKLLFEQLKLLDQEKPELLYMDTYKDDFKDMELMTDEQIMDNSSNIIMDVLYDFGYD